MRSPVSVLGRLLGMEGQVTRGFYATWGCLLMALKLGVDMTLLYGATGRWWEPLSYPSLLGLSSQAPTWAIRVMMLWALPFAWIGLSMTVRRAIDAGFSPWFGLLFCVPLLNLAVMVALCLPPSVARRPDAGPAPGPRARSGLRALGLSLVLAMVMAAVSIFALEDYGLVLFAGTPFAMGIVSGYTFNRSEKRSVWKTLVIALLSVVVAGAMVLLFAVEGLLCVVMALPLAVPLAILGGILGRQVAICGGVAASPVALLLVVMPPAAWIEPAFRIARPSMVVSTVHVEAAPEEVWRHLIDFEPIPPPDEIHFRLGIAYPVRARIDGHGVGAIRSCIFSTGAFVEPITTWNQPHELAFDVRDQPDPLRELSPYPRVYVDHLHGSIRSRRGRFRLFATSDGGTTLEGTTWYEISMFPDSYWTLWADSYIRSIHRRVLEHIKTCTEAGRAG